jgi:hypothetical protein
MGEGDVIFVVLGFLGGWCYLASSSMLAGGTTSTGDKAGQNCTETPRSIETGGAALEHKRHHLRESGSHWCQTIPRYEFANV